MDESHHVTKDKKSKPIVLANAAPRSRKSGNKRNAQGQKQNEISSSTSKYLKIASISLIGMIDFNMTARIGNLKP